MRTPFVTIVIPSRNRKEKLIRLLHSIQESTYKNIAVIIVDDFSDVPVSTYISSMKLRFPISVFRSNKSYGVAYARNKGIDNSKGEFILFIDDDNVIEKDMIRLIVDEFTKKPLLGLAGPVIYAIDKKTILWTRSKRNMWTTRTYMDRIIYSKNFWKSDDIPNTFMVRSSIIHNYNIHFNSELFPTHYEESDLAYKIKKIGYYIEVVGKARTYHDITYGKNGADNSLLLHHGFIDDRRIYYLAKNRLIFHFLYSSRLQFFTIILFWNWIFAMYYIKNIVLYKGPDKGSIFFRLKISFIYINGIFDGLRYICLKKI